MSSRESTEQGDGGKKGAQASQTPGAGGQAPQGSNRTEVYGRGEQEEKHHFAPGHAPSEQGNQENPGPERIKEHQQGFAGSGTGQSGEEVRHGRQKTTDPKQ